MSFSSCRDNYPWELGDAILGGEEIGQDLGYGPARFLDPPKVRRVATALVAVSNQDLQRRFDLDRMIAGNIYPCRASSQDELELAQHYFDQVSLYYFEAAADGNAMLWIKEVVAFAITVQDRRFAQK